MFYNKTLKKIIVATLLIIPFNSLCMKSIKKWEDVKEFSGEAVAYTTDDKYYIGGDNCYKLNNKDGVLYGIISSGVSPWRCKKTGDRALGFHLDKIINYKSFSMNTALINSNLKSANLKARRISNGEKWLIGDAIKNDLAKAESTRKKNMLRYFKLKNITIIKNLFSPDLKKFSTVSVYTKK